MFGSLGEAFKNHSKNVQDAFRIFQKLYAVTAKLLEITWQPVSSWLKLLPKVGRGASMCADIDKPFYYENRFFVIRAYRKNVQGAWYLGPKKAIVFDMDDALQFSTMGEASRAVARQPRNGLLFEIEENTQNIGPISPLSQFEVDLMDKIPFPYFFIAYEWYCGGDVRSWLLTYRSKSTFYRYRNKLIEYGIDISLPSKVVLIGEQSYC